MTLSSRLEQRLITMGFVLAYVALMSLLIVLTSPHFDGIRHVIVPALGGIALVGSALIVVAKIAGARR